MEFFQILPNKISCYSVDDATDDEELVGMIKRLGAVWLYYPERDSILTCADLQFLEKKLSDLNGDVA